MLGWELGTCVGKEGLLLLGLEAIYEWALMPLRGWGLGPEHTSTSQRREQLFCDLPEIKRNQAIDDP